MVPRCLLLDELSRVFRAGAGALGTPGSTTAGLKCCSIQRCMCGLVSPEVFLARPRVTISLRPLRGAQCSTPAPEARCARSMAHRVATSLFVRLLLQLPGLSGTCSIVLYSALASWHCVTSICYVCAAGVAFGEGPLCAVYGFLVHAWALPGTAVSFCTMYAFVTAWQCVSCLSCSSFCQQVCCGWQAVVS
jgi:hypothetical protein